MRSAMVVKGGPEWGQSGKIWPQNPGFKVEKVIKT